MAGAVVGVVCGAVELYLLMRAVRAVSQNDGAGSAALIVLLKIAALIAAFAVVYIFFRADLLYCGIGISTVLIVGSVVLFAKNNAKNKQNGQQAGQAENNPRGNGEQ